MKTKFTPVVEFISQKTINTHIKTLAKKIKQSSIEYLYIVGIARGGLNISKPLSKLLKIPHKTIRVSFYTNGIEHQYPAIVNVKSLDLIDKSKKILIVDDLIDGGHTFNWLNSNVKSYVEYDIGVIYNNERNRFGIKPTYFAEIKPDKWIVFPWEKSRP